VTAFVNTAYILKMEPIVYNLHPVLQG